MAQYPRILSIQSHVVYGYVGNKSATFPLQLLGFEVDPINSVQLCNHTGYTHVKGQILSDKELGDLTDGLAANNLDRQYTHLLTGYIGSETFLRRIATLVKDLKSKNENIIYVCDPVMGDDGEMYVPKELLPIYKDLIIPLVDIITPNQFEAELLTDCKINSIDDAWKAIDLLHKKGCQTVALSSTDLGDENKLLGLASSIKGDEKLRITIEIPKYSAHFTGTGDLFASVFLAWMYKLDDLQKALEKTVATLQAVIMRTMSQNGGNKETGLLELKLVQSKKDIEEPNVKILSNKIL